VAGAQDPVPVGQQRVRSQDGLRGAVSELAQGKRVPKTSLIPMHDLDKANINEPQLEALYSTVTNANC
jgi:hypothetical protein